MDGDDVGDIDPDENGDSDEDGDDGTGGTPPTSDDDDEQPTGRPADGGSARADAAIEQPRGEDAASDDGDGDASERADAGLPEIDDAALPPVDDLFGEGGLLAPKVPGPASPDNPPECPPEAPENPIGSCIGVPVYATCTYGTYACLCDWIHWLCI